MYYFDDKLSNPKMWEKNNRPTPENFNGFKQGKSRSFRRGPSLEVHWKLHVGCTAKILVQKL